MSSTRHTVEQFRELVTEYIGRCVTLNNQKFLRAPSIADFCLLYGYCDKQELQSLNKIEEFKPVVRYLINLIDLYHESRCSSDLYMKTQAQWQETSNKNIKIETPEKINISFK